MTPARGPGRTRVRSADEGLPPGSAEVFVSHARLTGEEAGGYPFDLPVVRALRAGGWPSTGPSPSSSATTARGNPPSSKLWPSLSDSTRRVARRTSTSPRPTRTRSWGRPSSCAAAPGSPAPPTSCAPRASSTSPPRSTGSSGRAVPAWSGPTAGCPCTSAPTASPSSTSSPTGSVPTVSTCSTNRRRHCHRRALGALARIHQLARAGAQFVVATHSPILLAVPDARILEIGDDGSWHAVEYDDSMPVVLTRGFLADPSRSLAELLDDGSGQG